MASFCVIERKFGDDPWTDLGDKPKVNYFKTVDDAWMCVDELKERVLDQDDVTAWQHIQYRVAVYVGPDDDERLWGYYE